MADELELSALEYAWSREPDDRGFALWMVTSSLERNAIALERLRPTELDGSVTAHGDDDQGDGRGHGSIERVATASGEDAAATHRPL